jgi:RNA polymerase sigma factor (sigma-70 family)
MAAERFDVERVVRAASAGDRSAVSELVERFAVRVRLVASQHRLDAHDVEDVVQTTWLRLLEHAHTIREPTAVGAWLETTARRESLRVIRASGRERPTDNDDLVLDAQVAPVGEQRVRAAEDRAALAGALKQLPDDRRELLSMLFAEPTPSYAEISRVLDIPVGSIGPTRARCLARLRADRDLVDLVDGLGAHGRDAGCIAGPSACALAA